MLTKSLFLGRLKEEARLFKTRAKEYFTPHGFIKLIKIVLLGISKLVVEGGSFLAQTYLGVPREISQVVSQALGITNGFILNSSFSFKTHRLLSVKFFKFAVVRLVSMTSGVIFMALIGRTIFKADNMQSDILAKGTVIILTGSINICGNKFFVFKE